MKKDEIIGILKQMDAPIEEDGPTVVVVERKNRQIPITIIRKKDRVDATVGKWIKRTFRIPIEELE